MVVALSPDPVLRFPVVCPICGSLEWLASELEMEQIREYADIQNLNPGGP
jgi:hypothetical protein